MPLAPVMRWPWQVILEPSDAETRYHVNCHWAGAVGGNVTQMRALVASLEAAVAFVRALAAAVPLLTQLLASSTVSDVHDAIGLLISYSKFGIDGAPAALRKMLPLVFSLDQGESSPTPV